MTDMEQEPRVVKIGLSEPKEKNGRQIAVVEFVNVSEVFDDEELDETSPVYTFDEVELIGEGDFYGGLGKITEHVENPPIDSIMNPRRPFQEVIELYLSEDEEGENFTLVVEAYDDESDEFDESDETTIFGPPQDSQRLN